MSISRRADNPGNEYYGQNTLYLPSSKWWRKLGAGGRGEEWRKGRRGHYFFTSPTIHHVFCLEIFPGSSIVSSRKRSCLNCSCGCFFCEYHWQADPPPSAILCLSWATPAERAKAHVQAQRRQGKAANWHRANFP